MFRKRIIIVDSDSSFCIALSAILKNLEKFQVINIYEDSKEALKRLRDDMPDIIIMDLDFAEMKGTEFIIKAKEKIPTLEVLILTYYEDEQIIQQALSYGASGILLKKKGMSRIIDSLETLIQGGSPIDPFIAKFILRSIQLTERSPLSPRESMVLKLLIQGKTYTSIASELFISGETVKSHLKSIYKKLKVNSKAQAIHKAVTEQLVKGIYGMYI